MGKKCIGTSSEYVILLVGKYLWLWLVITGMKINLCFLNNVILLIRSLDYDT